MQKGFLSAWLTLCLATALFGQEVQIAEFVATDIAFDSQESESFRTISAPGASFIKVHFDYFNLPAGVLVEVRNPEGTEVYTYGMNQRDDYTHSAALGENGWDRFASMSITGDKAIISLVSSNDVSWTASQGVYISRYMEGFPNGIIEDMTGEPLYEEESTCGVNERNAVACYSSSYPTEYDRARSVARLVMGGGLCTAWRVSDSNRMFTNNHCMASNSDVAGSESWFNYQYTTCNGTTLTTPVKVSGASMLATDSSLDYCLYTVNNFSNIQSFGNLGLDVRQPVQNEEIYIPQHGAGNPKELAITDDQNSTGLCRVDNPNDGTDAAYYCDTIGGSSGSPVLARSTHKVIALHHYGGCLNSGVKINLIWPQVSTHFGGVIPNGSGGGTGNQSPTASFTSTQSGLSVSFTSTSTDPDGTISSYAWNFGDGSSSNTQNPSHTYASSGTYTVSLSVTDNNNASGSTSASVTVSTGGDPSALTSGVPKTGLAATTGGWLHYYIDLPAALASSDTLEFSTTGSDPDADIYVKYGARPTTTDNDCKSETSSSNESCIITNPTSGRWYVSVYAYSSYTGLTLLAKRTVTGCSPYNVNTSNLSASQGTWKYYPIGLPACVTSFSATISGGNGDADLYVKQGAQPTTSSYDCRPYKSGNSETCSFTNPAINTWYVGLHAYSTYAGVTLNIKYE